MPPDASPLPPDPGHVRAHVAAALAEDLGEVGDLTGNYFLPAGKQTTARVRARTPGVLCGLHAAREVFTQVDSAVTFEAHADDGDPLEPGSTVAEIRGPVRALVAGERTALNYLQRLSGVATLTRRYVDAVVGTGAVILDTRKTTPGWRVLEKYAVRCGGGRNHRFGLHDAAMVKDNHLACGLTGPALADAIARLRTDHPEADVVVEVDTLEQLQKVLPLPGVTRILLDNMDVSTLRQAVAMAAGRVPLEASGGATLETVRALAETGVDCISVGALTHSAPALDLGMDFLPSDPFPKTP